ncbi:MAG: hypothetical protein ACFFG0_28105 [Candidatus Thorarchaeota archaeon]
MGWTPPSKFTVIITFLLLAFGIFILVDILFLLPEGNELLVYIDFTFGDYDQYQTWGLIALIILFLSWFIFYLGLKLSGL